jgi:hypothetical protein
MPGIEHEAAVELQSRRSMPSVGRPTLDLYSRACRTASEELMTTAFPRDDFIDGLLDQGRAEGEALGEARGEAKMLLRVLAARGFAVTDEVRERVVGCADTGRLETWADRAVTASSITEVFSD